MKAPQGNDSDSEKLALWMADRARDVLAANPDLAKRYGPAYRRGLVERLQQAGHTAAEAEQLADALIRNALFTYGYPH